MAITHKRQPDDLIHFLFVLTFTNVILTFGFVYISSLQSKVNFKEYGNRSASLTSCFSTFQMMKGDINASFLESCVQTVKI